MDIWIIRDGEKVGPIHDYDVRRKIETGELAADTPAWHEGLGAWRPLIEIELFTREFELVTASSEPEPRFPGNIAPDDGPTPPPLPGQTTFVRRFWARWFDLSLYSGIWWFCMWLARQNIESAVFNPWVMFLQFVPWFALEALLLHYYGTTPGKWLLGLKVVNKDGSLLTLPASIYRALRVMFTGVGFGWGFLALICQTLSLITARRIGAALWDQVGGHRVNAAPLQPIRVVVLVLLFLGALQLQQLVVSPVVYRFWVETIDQKVPGFKEMYEKNPPWHLPQRY